MTADEQKALKDRATALAKTVTRGLPTGTKEELEGFLHGLVDRIHAQDATIEELHGIVYTHSANIDELQNRASG